MSKAQSFTIELEPPISFIAEFSEDTWAMFDRFLEAAERLLEANLLKRRSGFTLEKESEEAVKAEVTGPSQEELAAYLLWLRPFQLHNESTSMDNVRSTLGKAIEDETVRKWLKSIGKQFRCEHAQVEYTAGSTQVNTERTLVDWLNTYQYHGDTKDRERLNELFEEPDLSSFFFVQMLKEKARAIFRIADFIDQLKQQRGTIATEAT